LFGAGDSDMVYGSRNSESLKDQVKGYADTASSKLKDLLPEQLLYALLVAGLIFFVAKNQTRAAIAGCLVYVLGEVDRVKCSWIWLGLAVAFSRQPSSPKFLVCAFLALYTYALRVNLM
jgi:hypothetical protein